MDKIRKIESSISKKKHEANLCLHDGRYITYCNTLFRISLLKMHKRAHHGKHLLKRRIRSTPKHVYILTVLFLFIVGTTMYIQFSCGAQDNCEVYNGPILNVPPGSGVEWIDELPIGWFDDLRYVSNIEDIAAAGFDIVLPYAYNFGVPLEDVISYTKVAAQNNLRVILEIPRSIIATDNLAITRLYGTTFGNSATIHGWYLADEPEINTELGSVQLSHAYDELKKISPAKPAYMAFFYPDLVDPFIKSLDGIMPDFYPATAGSAELSSSKFDCFRSRVSEFANRARKERKEFWFILQGIGEDAQGNAQYNLRLPTLSESKYMFYTSLLGRPKGLLYWVWFMSNKVWIDEVLSPMIKEFKTRFPGGIGYEDASGVKLNYLTADMMLLHSEANRHYLLIVSSLNKRQRGYIYGAPGMIFTTTGNSKIDIILKPYEVQLLDIIFTP